MRHREAQLLACDHGDRCFHLVVRFPARVFGPGLTRYQMRGLKASKPRSAMGLMAGSAKPLTLARAETRAGGKLDLPANAPPSETDQRASLSQVAPHDQAGGGTRAGASLRARLC